eukprot:scaffold298_cov247-Pinguiococcus_pyrenoidosus.AAC.29
MIGSGIGDEVLAAWLRIAQAGDETAPEAREGAARAVGSHQQHTGTRYFRSQFPVQRWILT